jgi:hypothetical protein
MEMSVHSHVSAAFAQGGASSAHTIICWVGSTACLDDVEKRRISCTFRESKSYSSDPPACEPTRYAGLAIPNRNLDRLLEEFQTELGRVEQNRRNTFEHVVRVNAV